MENKNDIMKSVLKLMRAMRRRPQRREHEFPPAVGRMLMTLRDNDGASPAELCEYMDVRPSSMSELLSRMEESGLINRVSNENDKRATRVFLSETGKESVDRIEEKFRTDNAKMAECFTDEELAQFCELCDRLSGHLEELWETEDRERPEHRGHCGPHNHRGPHGSHGPHGRPGDFVPGKE